MADGTHIDLGHAMITMIEPTRDPERLAEYNRWYEHDHAYSGVMVGPWAFSFRRWVATRDLKALRSPDPSTVAKPVDQGSYLALYWYLKDRVDEHFAWSFPQTQWLGEQGRMNPDREHISTSLYDFTGSANRPGWPVPAEIALDHPYGGLVVTWLDRAPDADTEAVAAWVLDDWAPGALADGSPLAQALAFAPRDFPGVPGTGDGVDEKVLVAWFTSADPRGDWPAIERALSAPVAASGVATLGLLAPFIPVIPGTPTYADQLW
ncbi:MAG: hypothetical protein WDA60_06035 [Acidimicrobiia bacterium]|jgi:hypothetical protein